MPDGSPPNPQPNPDDPWLEGLTFEQIARLVNENNPDVFYQRASAFDQAGARFQDVLDLIRHETNLVREAWTGKASEDFDAVVRELTGKIGNVLQFLQNPGYGAVLRDAGDRLADHQQRFRDLQGQKAQQEATPPAPGAPSPEEKAKVDNDSAKQILRDLRTAYWDIGNALTPLPYKAPGATVDTNTNPGNQNDRNNGHGNGQGSGEHAHGNPGDTHNFAPVPFFGPTALTKTAPAHPGESGGGEPFLFSGQNRSVLGRVDPGEQGPGVPGRPGPVFAPEPGQDSGSGVLGQARDMVALQGSYTGDTPGGPLVAAVTPGVLGRPAGRPDSCAPGTKGVTARATGQDTDRRAGEEEPVAKNRTTEHPSTEDATTEPVEAPEQRKVIRTAAEMPAPTEQAHRIAAQVVATTSGHTPATPGALLTPAAHATPAALRHALETDAPGRPVTFSLASGGEGGGVHQVVDLEPQARGMFPPGTATPDGLVGQATAETIGGATQAPSARGVTADPYAPGHMGGMPMGMMMGGMGGMGGSQQNGRMAAMPNEPRPEVWDPVTGAPNAVGRREPEPEEEQPGEKKLSQADVQAALAQKFAELDRLTERGK